MTGRLPSITALRCFEAAARLESFTRAARELNVTQGAVSRQIKSLEDITGVSLFVRDSRALRLTAHGETFYPRVCEALEQIERATRGLLEQSKDVFLTISVLPISAVQWVGPRLTRFRAQYPHIHVHMMTSPEPADFSSDIDLAIRVGRCDAANRPENLVAGNKWDGLVAEVLMPDGATPVCSPHLVTGKRPLRAPQDLKQHTLLHTATRPNAWRDWMLSAGLDKSDASGGLYFDHFLMAAKAAMNRKGVACMPRIVVEEDIAAGRLIAPLEAFGKPTGVYYLLYRHDRVDSPSLSAFRRWLYQEVAPYRNALHSPAVDALR